MQAEKVAIAEPGMVRQAVAAVAIGLYLRLRLDENPAFEKLLETERHRPVRANFRAIFAGCWAVVLLCGGLVPAWKVNHLVTSYLPAYLTGTLPGHGERGIGETAAQALQIGMLPVLMALGVTVRRHDLHRDERTGRGDWRPELTRLLPDGGRTGRRGTRLTDAANGTKIPHWIPADVTTEREAKQLVDANK